MRLHLGERERTSVGDYVAPLLWITVAGLVVGAGVSPLAGLEAAVAMLALCVAVHLGAYRWLRAALTRSRDKVPQSGATHHTTEQEKGQP